ncbi:nitroreductase family protein [Maribellus mangrovi]|uniref:nitroreductase family protein n=1 Tax=Maribellus mangrovi TaxID=3133146 RepID=UPI0030EF6F3A
MELLKKHISIRKFKEKALSEELLQSILYSGTRASTTGNMQLYSVVINREKDLRSKLAPLHFNQPVAVKAPVLLTFVADFNRFTKWCHQNNAEAGYDNFLSFNNALIDATLVAQNVCVAAENLGLGVCYLGTTLYNADKIIELLNLPKLTFPVTTVAIGYPDENPELTDRIPLEGIVHEETYSDYNSGTIDRLYHYKETLTSSKQFVKENSKEHLAQVFTDVRYKKADNEFFSNKMMEVLKQQGFLKE